MTTATLIHGDCIYVLRQLADCSVDSVVTDPPAGIGFMGSEWDRDKGGRDAWISWLASVMRECLRVLKPGGHALVWALPRTSHWTATAIEDAGFEIRDLHHAIVSRHEEARAFIRSLDVEQRRLLDRLLNAAGEASILYQVFGTGFPKSLTPKSARIPTGTGTALKPAVEHWILARKPLDGTVAENLAAHGTGTLNIDACRIDAPGGLTSGGRCVGRSALHMKNPAGEAEERDRSEEHPLGRWPAHLSLDETGAAALDEQSGERKSGAMAAGTSRGENSIFGKSPRSAATEGGISASTGGASRFFFTVRTECQSPSNAKDAARSSAPSASVDGSAASPAQVESTELSVSSRSGGRRGSKARSTNATQSASRPRDESDTQPTLSTDGRCLPASTHAGTCLPSDVADVEPSEQTGITGTTASLGTSSSSAGPATSKSTSRSPALGVLDSGEARFMYIAKPSRSERDGGLEDLAASTGGEATGRVDGSAGTRNPRAGAGRTGGAKNIHPTTKGIALMRWLVRLVTPPGGLVLDAFAGSGTTGLACAAEGMHFIGIEREPSKPGEPNYHGIALARLRKAFDRVETSLPDQRALDALLTPRRPVATDIDSSAGAAV